MAWQDYMTRLGYNWIPLAQQGYSLLDLFTKTRWLELMFESFWGRFFYMNVPMAEWIYTILFGGCVCGIIATTWALLGRRKEVFATSVSARILGCAGLAFVLLFVVATATSLYNDYQAQGRYFYPLIVPIAIFLTVGLYIFSKSYVKRYPASLWAAVAALVLLMALNAFCLVHYIYGHPYPDIPLPNF
jgi:hypothetical protein